MPKSPSKIRFICERCNHIARPGQVRRWEGDCPKCEGENFWSLQVEYVEYEAKNRLRAAYLFLPPPLAVLFLGFGLSRWVKHSNRQEFCELAPETAFFLTREKKQLDSRVLEYMRLRNSQELQSRGAIHCETCKLRFVPHHDKAWHQEGYCSKMCAAEGGNVEYLDLETEDDKTGMIPVTCPNQHAFEVMLSFSGCLRPCPQCGAKTEVP